LPNAYFLLFELVVYLQFALCLHHAWTHRPANVLRLLFGAAFGEKSLPAATRGGWGAKRHEVVFVKEYPEGYDMAEEGGVCA